jgi:hypothetical protein
MAMIPTKLNANTKAGFFMTESPFAEVSYAAQLESETVTATARRTACIPPVYRFGYAVKRCVLGRMSRISSRLETDIAVGAQGAALGEDVESVGA